MRPLMAFLTFLTLSLVVGGEAVGAVSSPAVPRCHTGDLALGLGRGDGAAGTIYYPVTLRNQSAHRCGVKGYPGVSFRDRRQRQVGRAARRDPGPVRRIVLRPGGVASAALGTSNVACRHPRRSYYLKVFPPDERRALLRRAAVRVCQIHVGPLRAGTQG